jgi:enoyl-CoA hydratase
VPVSLRAIESHIGILQVNRPQVRNALNWEAMQAFQECVEKAHAQTDLRALIVTGTPKAFIAGGDLKELHRYSTQADGERLSKAMSAALERLEALPCPTIAALDGPARGGGAEICLANDLRVMAEDADLGLVQVTLGLTPGWGAGQRLLRLVGYSRALELLVTGRVIGANEALALGLVNRLAPPGEALSTALELARQIASQPVDTVRAIKRLLRFGLLLPSETAAALEAAEFPSLWAAEEHAQAVERFLNRK